MKAPTLRHAATEARLILIGIPVFLWTMLPIYHLFLFAISPKESAFAGNLWPDHPTLQNFRIVFQEQHYYLNHFWLQMWNSLVIAVATGVLTLVVATGAAFAISRLRVRGGRAIMNLALEWTLDRKTTLFVRGENVFDHDYALAADFSTGGARVFAGFRWSM